MSHDEHDRTPLEGDIERVLSLVDGFDDGLGNCIDVRELFALWHPCCHRGLDWPRLDAEYRHAFAVDTIAQTIKKRREARLRGAIDVVGFATTVASHRREHCNRP